LINSSILMSPNNERKQLMSQQHQDTAQYDQSTYTGRSDDMFRLALYTFGILVAPLGTPTVQGFWEQGTAVFGHAAVQPGHIANAYQAWHAEPTQTPWEVDWGPWGAYAVPRFAAEAPQPAQVVQTLSLWVNLDAARAFVYGGPHLEALRQRANWMQPPAYPSYVLWWVDDATTPTWKDACAGLERLDAHGPTPAAFTFKQTFEPGTS